MNLRVLAAMICAAMLALGLAACGDDDNTNSDTGTNAAAESVDAANSTKPAVTFAAPAAGATIGNEFTAKVDLSYFTLNGKTVGKTPVDGEGHLHFSLDDGKYDYEKYSGANGKLGAQLGVDGKYSPSVAPEITYKRVPAGRHTLTVLLANNDHSDVGGKSTVDFTVK